MYRIKICKELARSHGIVSNQPIKNVEEVIDEMLNVCTMLKSSGQLIEHNKTKDHLEDKMMRTKLANKFAFGISVIFKGPRDVVDPASAKRQEVERLTQLENIYLAIPDADDLTLVNERNSYRVLETSSATK